MNKKKKDKTPKSVQTSKFASSGTLDKVKEKEIQPK